MYTSMTLLALSGLLAAAPSPSRPSWQKDYLTARKIGKSEGKPLAVFIGSGEKGFENVSRNGKITQEMQDILAKKYVCVYVDTAKEANQRWARAFRLDNGLVLSDRTGEIQAFRHEGSLARRDLTRYLEKFSDPDIEVRTTATHVEERASYYAPPAPVVQGYYGGFGGGGRGC
jgi:hypothetical protein